jgi:hypothetical protein
MEDLFYLSSQLEDVLSKASVKLYKQAEGHNVIKCGNCGDPTLVTESRPKLLTANPDAETVDEAQFNIALCCPKCCKEL